MYYTSFRSFSRGVEAQLLKAIQFKNKYWHFELLPVKTRPLYGVSDITEHNLVRSEELTQTFKIIFKWIFLFYTSHTAEIYWFLLVYTSHTAEIYWFLL